MSRSATARPFASLPAETLARALETALGRGGDFADVYLERRISRYVRIEEGVVRAVRCGTDAGLGVRVLAGERTGYASLDGFEPEGLMEAARAAAAIASGGGREATLHLRRSRPVSPHVVDGHPADVGLEQRIALALRIDAAARASDPRVRQVVASIGDEERWIEVANSEGLLVAEPQVQVSAAALALVEHEGRRERGQFAAGGPQGYGRFDRMSPEVIAAEAVRRAVVQIEAVEAPAGPQPVVIGNGWGGVLLHEAVGHGFEADFIRRRTSVFTGRAGERVAAPGCTIIDDGSVPSLRGSFGIDDEGVAGGPTLLIQDGVLEGFLHDRLSAARLSTSPTGNGRRQSYRNVPLPRQSNLYLAAGRDSPEEILRSVRRGLYARHIGGGQVDIANGNFVFQVTEGYLIEDGRVTRPVKNANLTGVGHEVLGRISRVGADLEFDPGIGTCGKEGQRVPVGVGQPTVLVSELTVGGTRV